MTSTTKEAFLRTIRGSLGRPGPTPPIDRHSLISMSKSRYPECSTGGGNLDHLIHTFEKEVIKASGQIKRVSSKDELSHLIGVLVKERGINKVVRWETPLLSDLDTRLTTDTEVSVKSIEGANEKSALDPSTNFLGDAQLGLTEADYAIADIGSIVLITNTNQSRLVSVLPGVHVAVIRPEKILPNLSTMLPLLKQRSNSGTFNLPSCITLITGPSRTADIETIRIIGVHGPVELHVFILDE